MFGGSNSISWASGEHTTIMYNIEYNYLRVQVSDEAGGTNYSDFRGATIMSVCRLLSEYNVEDSLANQILGVLANYMPIWDTGLKLIEASNPGIRWTLMGKQISYAIATKVLTIDFQGGPGVQQHTLRGFTDTVCFLLAQGMNMLEIDQIVSKIAKAENW